MKFNIRNIGRYKDVSVTEDDCTINLGILDGDEVKLLAESLLHAADSLVTGDVLTELLNEMGYELKKEN